MHVKSRLFSALITFRSYLLKIRTGSGLYLCWRLYCKEVLKPSHCRGLQERWQEKTSRCSRSSPVPEGARGRTLGCSRVLPLLQASWQHKHTETEWHKRWMTQLSFRNISAPFLTVIFKCIDHLSQSSLSDKGLCVLLFVAAHNPFLFYIFKLLSVF